MVDNWPYPYKQTHASSMDLRIENDSSTYLAISPDGILAASFNSKTKKIIIQDVKELESYQTNNKVYKFGPHEISKVANFPKCSITIKWDKINEQESISLAISNYAIIGEDLVAFIALSRFCDNVMRKKVDKNKNKNDEENGLISSKDTPVETFVFSTKTRKRIKTVADNHGGLVKFLNHNFPKEADQSNGSTNLIVMNAYGIAKAFIDHKDCHIIDQSKYKRTWVAKEYEFPTIIQVEIDELTEKSTCTNLLDKIFENNYLFVEDYKHQIIEMYNLKSMDLELTFQKHGEIFPSQERGDYIFSISKYGKLLAYCNGTKKITIHLMENGLEVTKKEFTDAIKILSISFIDDDERLLVVTENVIEETSEQVLEEIIEKDTGEASEEASEEGTDDTIEAYTKEANDKATKKTTNYKASYEAKSPTVYIWDLYTFINDVRKIDDESNIFGSLRKSNIRSIACSSGTILISLPDENICCGLSYVKSKLNSSEISPINQQAKKEQNGPVFVNKEPWVRTDKSRQQLYYLDESKTIQLIIGETTVQVWKENKGHELDLKYILSNLDGKQKIEFKSLKIGNCEFSIDLLCFDTNEENNIVNEMKENIHWPNKAHVLKDACVAMEYLYNRRYEPVGSSNLSKYEEFVTGTEKLIKRCIKEKPGLWSLSEVRYGIMANIIRSKNISLLHWILFDYEADSKKQVKKRVSRNLHIPSQYEWTMEMKISDLMIAINQTLGENRRDKSIVAMLLEYYSNNAEKDTGWMFTLTKSLPSLSDHFEPYLKDLFYKPCFGSKEELVDSKFISQSKLKKGFISEICSLNVRPRLLMKPNDSSFWNKLKSKIFERSKVIDEKIAKLTIVRVVPLPDFTVFPTKATDRTYNNWMIPLKLIKIIFLPRLYLVNDKSYFSPCLEFLSKNKNEQLYDNPSMEACIDFKWGAARNHFLRHFALFIAFSFTFAYVSGNSEGFAFPRVLFFYLGYYLLATELVQSKHEGLKKYFSIYNLLDLASIILAVVTMINFVIFRYNDNDQNEKNENTDEIKNGIILQAFAILLLWLELLLLTRYFRGTATYIRLILNILKAILPFLVFMVIATVAFGHAMHIILKQPDLIDLKPNGDTYKFEVANSTNPYLEGLTIKQVIDINDPMDNYYGKLKYSALGAYFWILGRWDQLEKWDFWPIYVISIGASILIVIIMQNLLIAFMTGVYDKAKNNVRTAVLGYRANLIADYETLEKPFGSARGNPRYIYYVGNVEYQEKWLHRAEKYRKLYKSLLIEDINYLLSKCTNDSDDDKNLNVANKGKDDDHEGNTNITNNELHFKLQDEMKKLQISALQ
ncbi:19915_t:CDS:10 [Funneliformis geosporum]|uniref:19915_t:CDS:1 n=1 Tax=Funneliformis geosporum TaxID=1117311 RepID=A0A9W4SBG8_9GLOM|nr:19915_t:CDS:10 [Funneliformis geosporum]